jgi:hypothetical protein
MARFRKKTQCRKRKNNIKYTSGKKVIKYTSGTKVKKISKSLLEFSNGLLNHLNEIECSQMAIKLYHNLSHLLPQEVLQQVIILNINRSENKLKFKILEIECKIQFFRNIIHEGEILDLVLLHLLGDNIAIALPEHSDDGQVSFRNCDFKDSIWEEVFQEQMDENNYTLLQLKCWCSQIFSQLTCLLVKAVLEN